MDTNQAETDRRKDRKELDVPYFEKARKQWYEKDFGLKHSGKDIKREAERYLDEIFGKRHKEKWTDVEHYKEIGSR